MDFPTSLGNVQSSNETNHVSFTWTWLEMGEDSVLVDYGNSLPVPVVVGLPLHSILPTKHIKQLS